jgi:isoleucyl-tRNA synthetase
VYSFFTLYANAARGTRDGAAGAGFEAAVRHDGYTDPLDRYLMAQTGRLVRGVQAHLDAYDISTACDLLREYLDMLTNWYVRRSRQRFFDEDADAFDALYTALEAVCRVAAPLLPLVTEEIWRGLTGGRSVHLTDWPDPALFADDPALVEQMDRTQAVCSAGSSLRKAAKLRVRLPLAAMTVVVPGAASLAGSEDVIAGELNLKAVRLLDAADASEEEFGIERRLVVNARAAGPRLGKGVQTAIKGSKSGDWSVADDGSVTAGGIVLEPHEYTLETVVDPAKAGEHAAVAMLPGGGFVVLDTGLTPELEAEGLARDLVRVIQQARKDADLAVGDRIRASVTAKANVIAAAREHAELLEGETLAVELELLVADVEPSALVERVVSDRAERQGAAAGEAGQ